MKHMLVALAIAVAVLSFPDAGQAATIFFASLTNSQENPPVVLTLDGVFIPPAGILRLCVVLAERRDDGVDPLRHCVQSRFREDSHTRHACGQPAQPQSQPADPRHP